MGGIVAEDPIDGRDAGQETGLQRSVGLVATATGFAVTAGTVPQALAVWSGDAAGVSLLTWSIILVNMAAWLAYGLAHRRWPIVAVNVPGILTAGAVVLGLLCR